jgi:hypothetical protein
MAWSCSFTECSAECRFSGPTDGEDIFAADFEMLSHRYDGQFQYALLDFTQADSMTLLTADLIRVAEKDRQYLLRNPPYSVVLIAPQGVVFGHARMYERFMEGTALRSKVVQTREQAMEWLRGLGFNGQFAPLPGIDRN